MKSLNLKLHTLNKLIAILDGITHPSEWNFSPGKISSEKSLVSEKARAVSSTSASHYCRQCFIAVFRKSEFFSFKISV